MSTQEFSIAALTEFFHAYNAEYHVAKPVRLRDTLEIDVEAKSPEWDASSWLARILILTAWLGPPLIVGVVLCNGLLSAAYSVWSTILG